MLAYCAALFDRISRWSLGKRAALFRYQICNDLASEIINWYVKHETVKKCQEKQTRLFEVRVHVSMHNLKIEQVYC